MVIKPLLPGSTIGVFGSGQLGRMLTLAARRMGYQVHIYSPESNTPAGQVADQEIVASYEDANAVRRFAQAVQVITYEFENVPVMALDAASRYAPVRPSRDVLYTAQNRLREKTFLAQAGLPVTPFRAIHSLTDLTSSLKELGYPAVLKTSGWGYDGKGQVKIKKRDPAQNAYAALGGQEGILEQWIDFTCELSVVAARGIDGTFVPYEVFQNEHQNHILDVTLCPAKIPSKVAQQAIGIARQVCEKLQVVGVLCVEMFLTKTGKLLINELAPRPHNSGHLTVDACITSQFEQQLRAVCGLDLGSPQLLRPAAMANLLGDIWQSGEPRWDRALSNPNVKLHLYGKSAPRPGRKMGHLTALAETLEKAKKIVLSARAALKP